MRLLIARLLLAAGVAAVGANPATSQALPDGEKPKTEVRLDLDGDGKLDLARLVDDRPRSFELHIFYGVGEGQPDAGRKPDFVKPDIAGTLIVELSVRGKRSLVVTDDCGGCSNTVTTSLVIVHRQGRLMVARLDQDWETRTSTGRCTINFLAGKGEIASPFGRSPRPIRKPLKLRTLAAWDFYDGRELCSP
jgi:hypothetical protein